MKKTKLLFSILDIFEIIYLGFLVNLGNLFDSNLSRVCNRLNYGYLMLNIMTLIFGFISFVTLRKMKLDRYKYLGFVSLFLGSLIRYSPDYPNAFTSNLHLIFAYISLFSVTIIQIVKLYKFKIYNFKIENILKYMGVIIFAYCLYSFLNIGFVNNLSEWLYLSYLLLSDLIIYNIVE